jgi:hypothetical protein
VIRRLCFASVLTAALAALLAADVSAQCAMCRTVLASPEGQKMVAALRSGILLLLAAPFAIFAAVAGLAVRTHRRRLNGGPARPASLASPRASHPEHAPPAADPRAG